MKFKEVQKETLIDYWREVEQKTGIKISYSERVDSIVPGPKGGFTVTTSKNTYDTRTVLLSIGRRGTPRKLGVPGEEMEAKGRLRVLFSSNVKSIRDGAVEIAVGDKVGSIANDAVVVSAG